MHVKEADVSGFGARPNVGIWLFGLGYFFFYIFYSALAKALSAGALVPGGVPVSGFALLPTTCFATAVSVLAILFVLRWWPHAQRRQLMGVTLPCPGLWTTVSGIGTALIIATTTLAYTFHGISIVFALLLMRAGVLILAPLVDALFLRKVRWYSWVALGLSLCAVGMGLSLTGSYALSAAALINLTLYLGGYVLRLQSMTRVAKTDNRDAAKGYFVEEQMVSLPLLLILPAIGAMLAPGEVGAALRYGYSGFLTTGMLVPALSIGLFYACLFVFGSLIYLDKREHTFCVPVNRCASLLSGLVATYLLVKVLGHSPPAAIEFAAVALILVAIGFLAVPEMRTSLTVPQRLFVFVCSGNTSRSPMAQRICSMALAAKLGISAERLAEAGVHVMSAGLTVNEGAPMTSAAQQALLRHGVPPHPHVARELSDRLVEQAELIICMTEGQRDEVLRRFPMAATKTERLDATADVADPSGRDPNYYDAVAQQLALLVQQRFASFSFARSA